MQEEATRPRRRIDRLALTVMAVALAAVVGISAFIVYKLRTDAQPAQPAAEDSQLRDAVAEVRKWIEESPRPAPPATVKPAPPPAVVKPAPPPVSKPAPQVVLPPPPPAAAAMRFQLTDRRPPKEKRDSDAGAAEAIPAAGTWWAAGRADAGGE